MSSKEHRGQLKGWPKVTVWLAVELIAEGAIVAAEVGAIAAEGIHHGTQPGGGGAAALEEALGEGRQIEPASPELYLSEGVEQQAVIGERVLGEGTIGQHQAAHAALQGMTAGLGPIESSRRVGACGGGQPAANDK